jgi:hypothetical protein
MIETVVIYFIFLFHWLELTFGTAVSTGIKGVSLGNLWRCPGGLGMAVKHRIQAGQFSME